MIADLWWAMLSVAVVVMAGTIALLAIAIRCRRNGPGLFPLDLRKKRILVVVGGVVLPVVSIAALVTSSLLSVQATRLGPGEPDLTVEIEGVQWWWRITYLDDEGSPIATTANEIHIPVGKSVRLRLKTNDVIHSFWVPNLQGKTDLIPGRVNYARLRALEAGVYRGQCAEFCGVQHALMGFLVIAEPEDDFRVWLRAQGRPADQAEAGTDAARGLDIFMNAGCSGCHTIRGTKAVGTAGPDLTHLASRRTLAAATIPNTKGYLGGWIADPQHLEPGNKMVVTALPPRDFRALLRYLGSLQ